MTGSNSAAVVSARIGVSSKQGAGAKTARFPGECEFPHIYRLAKSGYILTFLVETLYFHLGVQVRRRSSVNEICGSDESWGRASWEKIRSGSGFGPFGFRRFGFKLRRAAGFASATGDQTK